MTPTSTPFGPDFVKELIPWMFQIFDEATRKAYHMLWDMLIAFLVANWGWVLVGLVVILLFAFFEYLATGRWATLGSVLYTYIYYGFLFLAGLVFGPELFANDWIKLLLLVVYVVSFLWVRMILNGTGIRKH